MRDAEPLPPPEPPRDAVSAPDRREVLRWLGMLTLAGAAAPSLAGEALRRAERLIRTAEADGGAGKGRSLSAAEWKTAAAWQDTLLPQGPEGPGAKDVNATGYLDAVLADPDVPPADRAMVRAALPRLDELAKEARGVAFADLAEADRIAAVERLRADPTGFRTVWLGLMFTVEALFGDPVYGGNPGGIGWTSIGYVPPKPRPSAPQGSFPR